MKSKTQIFFFKNRIFKFEEFVAAMGNPKATCKAMLAHHVRSGNIVPIRRGLYASIPFGADYKTYPVDPFLVINALSEDAVIAYHSALQFHGIAYSIHFKYVFLSNKHISNFSFRSEQFIRCKYPTILSKSKKQVFVNTVDYLGYDIKVTSIERTLIDVLDRINLSGGWEEVWRSASSIPKLDVEKVVAYACCLKNTTIIAKLGLFLSRYKKTFGISQNMLAQLKKKLGKSPNYLDRQERQGGKYLKEWNIFVPEDLIKNFFEEKIIDMS